MGEKLVIGPINKGLKTDRTAFNIDNDSFPYLINAYQWRGRVKRKRGTSLLGRLTRYFNSSSTSYSSMATITLVAGSANILTGFSLETKGGIIPGSVTILDTTSNITYTDPGMAGVLVGAPSGSGTINYASGIITIVGGATHSISVIFLYNPNLPVMGLEELVLNPTAFPGTLAFDTTYAYNILTAQPYSIYDVSFYKNPPNATYTDGTTPYVAKTAPTSLNWNGQDYQQFWTTNYQGSLWATNGMTFPFTTTNIGMQFKPITTVTVNSATNVTLTISAHGLVVGDFLFINEVVTTTGINYQTGYVSAVTDPNNVVVIFPEATITTNGTGGIAQYLTNTAIPGKDCLRFYDGDPTNSNPTNPALTGVNGWVNFSPPLSQFSYVIADNLSQIYYLVGARIILPFKDRLLFIGPVIQSSGIGALPIYLQDTVIYSQNGTPYYTCSYTNTPSSTVDNPISPLNVFFPILVPINQTATSPAYFEDQTGFGGYATSGLDVPIVTASFNEDAIIMGLTTQQVRFVYSGNDIIPFNFFIINSELPSNSTFSAINMDQGVISRGNRGYIITGQTSAQRIDLEIPNQVFETNLTNNGAARVCSQRDFMNEWIYFTYVNNTFGYIYPTQTLLYNYRDDSWAIFNESYTTYGSFRKRTGYTWATIGLKYKSWNAWTVPWNSGSSTLLQLEVIAGNQQGFVMVREDSVSEATSLYIQNISGNTITSPNHCLNNGDYIMLNGIIGPLSTLNGSIFSVVTPTANTFLLNPSINASGYIGGGTIIRMYMPSIKTKQFPVAWGLGRKTRIGVQQYLLSKTTNGQITLLIYLSQDSSNPYNTGSIIPTASPTPVNNSLVYSTVLYTCPESTNLGLTPANVNLQTPTAQTQAQIWHRINTSLIGDTIQLGFTLSDAQMRDLDVNGLPISQFSEIELHSMILDVTPSQLLS